VVVSALFSFLIIFGGNYTVAYFLRYQKTKKHVVLLLLIAAYCWILCTPPGLFPIQTSAYWLAPVLSALCVAVWISFIFMMTKIETDCNLVKPFARKVAIVQSLLVIFVLVGTLFSDIPWLR
jgi:hypothetical protein